MKKKIIEIIKRDYLAIIAISMVLLLFGSFYFWLSDDPKAITEYVYSREGKKEIKETIRSLDSEAFTKNGVIKSYKLDEKSFGCNGLYEKTFTIYFNNDKDINIDCIIRENNDRWSVLDDINSVKLDNMLEKKYGKNY